MRKNNKIPLFERNQQKYQQTANNFVLMNQVHLNDEECIPSQFYRQSKRIAKNNNTLNTMYNSISRIKQGQFQNPDSKQLVNIINKGLSQNNKRKTFDNDKSSEMQINQIVKEVIAIESSPELLPHMSKNFKEILRVTSEPQINNKEIPGNKLLLANQQNEQIQEIKVNRPNVIFNFPNYYENQIRKIKSIKQSEKESIMNEIAQKQQEQQYRNREYYYEKANELNPTKKNKSHKFEKQPIYSQRQISEKSFYLKQKDIVEIQKNNQNNIKNHYRSYYN